MGESAEELKIKMQSTESIVNHVSGTHNGFAGMENHVDSGGDRANGNANHISSSQKHEGSSSSSKHKEGSGSSSSSKHKEHHSSKHRDDHKSKHKEGHSSSSSKSKDGSSSSSSKQKDGSSSSPSKSSSLEKHKESSHSKDKHHSSSKHSNSEHKLHSKSSSSDKHKDGSSKTSSSADKPKEGVSKSSSSSLSVEKQKDGSVKTSSSDKHKEGSGKTSSSSSADKHRDPSSKHSSDKHNSTKSSSSSSALDKHKDGSSSKSSTSIDKHKESSSKHSSDKHKDSSTKSSSTHEKHKEGSSKSASSSEKHKSSSSDKHRDGSSKSHSSSSDKHKDGSSKTSSEKVKELIKSPDKKDRPKDSDKHRDKSKDESRSKSHNKLTSPSKDAIKTEPVENNVDVKPKKEDDMQPFVKMENMECEDSAGDDVKKAPSSDEDEVPLSARMKKEVPPVKHQREESSDDEPLSARMEKVKKVKKEVKDEDEDFKPTKKRKLEDEEEDFKPTKKRKLEDEDEDFKPTKKRKHEDDDEFEPAVKKKKKKIKTKGTIDETKPQKGKKKNEEEQQVWKWWEEEKRDDGIKWTFLEHKGPVFAPLYERLPKNVKFYYDGREVELSEAAEEVAGFYAKMLDHDYTTKDVFNTNFFRDWRKVMTKDEREVITDLKKCNFKEMHQFYLKQSEERKNRTKEQKQELKRQNEEVTKEYGFCIIDGHKEKIGNFRIEPPGLFRGRGDHPKQGRLKKRVEAEEVIINCSKDSKIPVAPEGHKWKEVRHDNSVTWLASWTENIQGATKYVMLNAASKLKGEKDWQKYEIARKLHKCVDKIRATYREDWKSKEMRVRQRAVALYFIDKLALRAGNEKEEGETADTVGCCSLRVEHIKLYSEKDGKECVVEFDFLGKDSIRYQNSVPVEKRVFKNLQLFIENKQPEDDLFDRLNTTLMNKHLHDLMEGLTAKVFRTYNASRTLQEQLDLLTNEEDAIPAKLLSYNRANRAVAILCNHQRSAPKTFAQSMENLINKVEEKRKQVKEAKKDIKDAKSDYKNHSTERNRALVEKKKKALKRLEEQLTKLEVQATDKEENKEIALGTSKLNYLDPRISVAWCKKWDIPIEKVYNKTQRDKFRWAIDMATDDFKF